MPTNVLTESPGKDVCRYLKHWANSRYVDRALLERHSGLSKEQRRRKSRAAAFAILQGLEFLDGAAGASILTRPLPLFYAVENIVKGVALINDPSLDPSDFRAHGLRGDKSRRYSVKNFVCGVQNPGSDVWSRAHRLLNGDWVKLDMRRDGEGMTMAWRTQLATASLSGRELKFGDLIRHLPEMAQDVVSARWGNPYVVHVSLFDYQTTTEPPSATVHMTLRHAHDQDTRAMILRSERTLLADYTRGRDALDVIAYSRSTSDPPIGGPMMRSDLFGSLYMDFGGDPPLLSELLTYHAALFILSDVVRYQVDQWARLLDDHPEEAILVERFLEVAGRKVPNLALNELERDFYRFTVST